MTGSGDGIDFPNYPAKPTVRTLEQWAFDTAAQDWKAVPFEDRDATRERLAFATFNTWFQGGEKARRYRALLEALGERDADVIVLQEVTMDLLDEIMAAGWLRAEYSFVRAPFRAQAVPSHGVMLLSRLPLVGATLYPLPSHMGRSMLVAQVRIQRKLFTFATVHLESMRTNADTRGEQLRAVFQILEDAGDTVVAGDFNFCSSWEQENRRIDARYLDMWAVLRPGEAGYTQDTDVNRMLADAKRDEKRVRIDRVLLRSDAARWQPHAIELLGTRPVASDSPRIFPSDHFGLAATLRRAS